MLTIPSSSCICHIGKPLVFCQWGVSYITRIVSIFRWGVLCLSQVIRWKLPEPLSLCIDCLELSTVLKVFKHFAPLLTDKHLMVRTDNKTATAYINRQRGVHSVGYCNWPGTSCCGHTQPASEQFTFWANRIWQKTWCHEQAYLTARESKSLAHSENMGQVLSWGVHFPRECTVHFVVFHESTRLTHWVWMPSPTDCNPNTSYAFLLIRKHWEANMAPDHTSALWFLVTDNATVEGHGGCCGSPLPCSYVFLPTWCIFGVNDSCSFEHSGQSIGYCQSWTCCMPTFTFIEPMFTVSCGLLESLSLLYMGLPQFICPWGDGLSHMTLPCM